MSKIIAIGGVSRSGKTSLALWLHKHLADSMMLSQDDFVQPEELIPRVRDRIDWEHPDSVNWQAWQRAIVSNRKDCSYLILEGLLMFQDQSLTVEPDLCYYLTMDKASFLEERKNETRWGYEPPWYIEHVWKSHALHGTPFREKETIEYHNIQQSDYPEILNQITS
jgi:uridine kinase